MAEGYPQHRAGRQRNSSETVMPHRQVDEAIAEQAVDPATLLAENESLRDRLLRALADAENTRRRAEQMARETRQYAIADFARWKQDQRCPTSACFWQMWGFPTTYELHLLPDLLHFQLQSVHRPHSHSGADFRRRCPYCIPSLAQHKDRSLRRQRRPHHRDLSH